MAPRAVEVLRSVDLILAEDTRTSYPLRQRFNIDTPCASYHKFNEHDITGALVNRISQGQTMALISDAGTPAISDPGFLLTRECRKQGVEVETLPGPTAFVPALVNSGLPCDRFVFEGFLPVKKGRSATLEALAADDRTFIIYESPLRLVKTLEQLAQVCGPDREASVSREISKIHNSTVNGTLAELSAHFQANPPRGEIVIVVAGKPKEPKAKTHRNKFKDPAQDTNP